MIGFKQTQEQRQRLTPMQVMEVALLPMRMQEMEQRIAEELEKNPALEIQEGGEDSSSEERSEEGEARQEGDTGGEWDEMGDDQDDYRPPIGRDKSSREDRMEQRVAEAPEFRERLSAQLSHLNFTEEEQRIAEEIIWNLDGRGYLTVDLHLLADRLCVSVEKVELALRRVQRLNPPGSAARNLREALLLQLERSGVTGLPRRILEGHFDDFANRRLARLEEALGCGRNALKEALDVLGQLSPSPAAAFAGGEAHIIPDFLIESVDGNPTIVLNDSRLPTLRISPTYLHLLGASNGVDSEARRFLRNSLNSARWFLQALERREVTLLKVMKAIHHAKEAYLSGAAPTPRPMTIAGIARAVRMHPSTVSRAVREKFVQAPAGLFALRRLFTEGTVTVSGEEVSTDLVRQELDALVKGENLEEPLSDEALAAMLNERGFPIARRTVAKYRGQLKIPPARLRGAFTRTKKEDE